MTRRTFLSSSLAPFFLKPVARRPVYQFYEEWARQFRRLHTALDSDCAHTHYEAYALGIKWGWFTPEDIREIEAAKGEFSYVMPKSIASKYA